MTSLSERIELIEKVMDGVTRGDWYLSGKLTIRHKSVVGGADGWVGKVNWRNDAAYIVACNPVAITELLAAARKAEALEREKALYREAVLDLELACEQLAATRTNKIYKAMIDGGQAQGLRELDVARLRARALLGGSDAE